MFNCSACPFCLAERALYVFGWRTTERGLKNYTYHDVAFVRGEHRAVLKVSKDEQQRWTTTLARVDKNGRRHGKTKYSAGYGASIVRRRENK